MDIFFGFIDRNPLTTVFVSILWDAELAPLCKQFIASDIQKKFT